MCVFVCNYVDICAILFNNHHVINKKPVGGNYETYKQTN